ncbi:protein sickie-like isoform X2 [Limulus polyphemus]|uniref:Protein sickie-like isoform X2 n=1 Tax=Limulus polyphemus TaxID=6850 RepID=A0ABM1T4A6_LIMPO|nr:protein sickie-like isoform X2 [Limulus polyphemus]
MFDKFKFFNSKEKSGGKAKGGVFSKRTSSSSGFSSAKSEKSDSSNSICSESKSGLTSEEPKVSTGLTSPGTSGPKVVAQKSSKKTFVRSSIKDKKYNNSKITEYSKEDLTTKLESLKSTPINLSDCATPLKEKSERSVHKKKLENKEISTQKINSEPINKVYKPVQKESIAYKNLCKPSTTQKNITGYTEFGAIIDKTSDRVEFSPEKYQLTQTTNAKFENGSCGTQEDNAQSTLKECSQKDCLACIEKKNEGNVCGSSNMNTKIVESSNKTRNTPETKPKESKNSKEDQYHEGEQNVINQSKVFSLLPTSERVLQTPNSDISTKTTKKKSARVSETSCPNSSCLLSNQGENSSITKPTAAVKGMTKYVPENVQECNNTPSRSKDELEHNPEDRDTFNASGSTKMNSDFSDDEKTRNTQIKTSRQRKNDLETRQKSDLRSNNKVGGTVPEQCADGSHGGITVAKVSPIMISDVRVFDKISSGKQYTVSYNTESKKNENYVITDRNAKMQECEGRYSQTSRSRQMKASEELFHVADPKDSPSPQNEGTNLVVKKCRLYDTRNTGLLSKGMTVIEESEDVMGNIKPMPPLTRALSHGYIRGLNSMSSNSNPMYRAKVSHPMPTTDNSSSNLNGPLKKFLGKVDYVSMDIASGYLSDGEILQPSAVYRVEDLSSGYMSEDGGFIYPRRVTTKVNGNDMIAKTSNILDDDRKNKSGQQRLLNKFRLDDSSSVSSGLSDTIADVSTDDNLTGSSVSPASTYYGSLKREQRGVATKYSLTSGENTRRGWEEHHIGVTTSGKYTNGHSINVAKTDSSMQTDSSAFHQMSSIKWKKYLQQHQEQQVRTGKSKSESGQRREYINTSSVFSTSNIMENKNSASNVVLNKYESYECQKPKNKAIMRKTEDGKYREGDIVIEKEIENGRSSCSKYAKITSTLVNQLVQPPQEQRRAQGSRTVSVAGIGTNNEKRPSSTSTASSSGSNRTGGSKAQSNSKKEKSHDTRYNDSRHLEPPDRTRIQSSSLPRNISITPSNGKNSFERRGKIKESANIQTKCNDAYIFNGTSAHSDSEYSSLGRRKTLKQNSLMSSNVTGFRELAYGTCSAPNDPSNPISDYVILPGLTGTSKDCSINRPRLSIPIRPSDGNMGNYANIGSHPVVSNSVTPSYSWLRYSGSSGVSVISGSGTRSNSGGGLTEADSMESLSSTSSGVHAQIQHARANSLTHARLILHQKELSGSSHLSRSNSIRSTTSEKLYPSMLQRSDEVDSSFTGSTPMARHTAISNTNGQPITLNTKSNVQGSMRHLFPVSSVTSLPQTSTTSVATSNARISHYMGGLLSKENNRDDEMHGSSLSVVSSSSNMFTATEDKQSQEIKKLKRELEQANEKVTTLTSQLTTNAHMVAAFEQSLSNMTNRLHHLTASAEQKDSELGELRSTIDALSKQSTEAGLTKMALQSMQAVQRTLREHKISRQMSTDSMSSVNSVSSGNSGNSRSADRFDKTGKKKKKGWLRSSFSKAFSRSKKNKNGSVSDVEDLKQFLSDSSTPSSPSFGFHHVNSQILSQTIKSSHSSSALHEKDEEISLELVNSLKKQLRDKEMVITDIRLEALTSAQQLEALKETVNRMQNEMVTLKQDNSQLQKLVSVNSLTSSQSSLPQINSVESLEKRLSTSTPSESPCTDTFFSHTANNHDGKHVTISVFLGLHGDCTKFKTQNENTSEVVIGDLIVNANMRWDVMDSVVKQTFKEYLQMVDPLSNLGLNTESILSYCMGEIVREKDSEDPELLPCDCIVANNMQIQITLKGTNQNSVDGLTFETLIPKSVIQRYVSLLTDHRRIILCGPSGTGKTYLAQKLAEFLILRNMKEISPGAIATFGVDHKSAKELRHYLSNVAEQCESSNPSDLPAVIILDNLQHVGSLGEVFNGFLSAKYQTCPYIIGTMNQTNCSTTNLQLHHNFRWILCANHMEPVKGFLSRFLRRKLVEHEIQNDSQNPELAKIIDWIPKVWAHLNKFLETHSSSDVTIGPRLFLSCPIDVDSSQVWFRDLWNYSIVPYLMEAVREGLQLYGRQACWNDPIDWVYETYPWPTSEEKNWPQLLRLRTEDVGYESLITPGTITKASQSSVEADPLLNMLMRLQEAASSSSPHVNHGDNKTISHQDNTFTSTNLMSRSSIETMH